MIFASISSSYSLVWPIAASFGGLIVLWGLWMEEGEEKDWFSSAAELRRQKSKAKWGRWAVMIGIGVEIGIGFALAAKDEIVERQPQDRLQALNPQTKMFSLCQASLG